MVTITLKTKKGVIHKIEIVRGNDYLSTLDNFLKKNKLSLTNLRNVLADCLEEDRMSCRLAKMSSIALMLKIKGL